LIEDDFLLIYKRRDQLDEKGIKRKIKAEEKMAMKELKKDTLAL
jgi:hypothetical protein